MSFDAKSPPNVTKVSRESRDNATFLFERDARTDAQPPKMIMLSSSPRSTSASLHVDGRRRRILLRSCNSCRVVRDFSAAISPAKRARRMKARLFSRSEERESLITKPPPRGKRDAPPFNVEGTTCGTRLRFAYLRMLTDIGA